MPEYGIDAILLYMKVNLYSVGRTRFATTEYNGEFGLLTKL